MKIRSTTHIKFQKIIISKLTNAATAKINGGLGTSPKCAFSEWETCEAGEM